MTEGDDRSLRQLLGTEPWSVRCSHLMDKEAGHTAGSDLK
jgi:hypothetical protein